MSVWKLDNDQAHFQIADYSGTLSLQEPSVGVIPKTNSESNFIQAWLGIQQENLKLQESYVREQDCIASYACSTDPPFDLQIYWSVQEEAFQENKMLACQILVSAQTDQLESYPRANIVSKFSSVKLIENYLVGSWSECDLPAESPIVLSKSQSSGLFRISFLDSTRQILVMIHPVDYHGLTLSRDGDGIVLSTRLFDQAFLEKGVILRSRVKGVAAESILTDEAIESLHQEFCSQKLPLTT